MKFNNIKSILTVFLITFICVSATSQNNQKFKVVLDAGHGDHDFGACYHGHVEKKINLEVTLKVGKILEKNPSIQVIYTRKTDVFVTLKDRANLANKEAADLFVSIHCNANKNTAAYGTETYVMGMSRAGMNLEVSKTENSVIFLEKDYKQTYKGFDPNNPETLIGLKMVQENNLINSINLASKVQDNFLSYDLKSRGVKQEPLWVLDASVMPGVLIETGFISNKEEGARLDSEEGQMETAAAIAQAIVDYKNEYYGTGGNDPIIEKPKKYIPKVIEQPKETVVEPIKEEIKKDEVKVVENKPEASKNGIIFKVQLSASSKKMSLTPNNFKGLRNITSTFEKNLYKYMYGATSSFDEVKKMQLEAKSKGYSSAFIVAFKDGNSIDVNEAVKQ